MKKRVLLIVLALIMLIGSSTMPVFANSSYYYTEELAEILAKELTIPEDSSIDPEIDWLVFTLGLYENKGSLPAAFNSRLYAEYVDRCVGNNSDIKLTDIARWLLALGIVQAEQEYYAVQEILLKKLEDRDFKTESETNAIAYALIALDGYELDLEEQRESLLNVLIDAQRENGGFNFMLKADPENEYSLESDVDSTCAVLTALAPHREISQINEVIESALEYLKSAQRDSGGFGFGEFPDSADSAAQVVIALSSLGIDPNAWSRDGGTPVTSMESFRLEDHAVKGFGDVANTMSGRQVLLAHTALARLGTDTPVFSLRALPQTEPSKDIAHMAPYIAGGLLGVALIVAAVIIIKKKRAKES